MPKLNMGTDGRLAYGVQELADKTGLSGEFLRREAQSGRLRVRRIGRRRLVVLAEDWRQYVETYWKAAEPKLA